VRQWQVRRAEENVVITQLLIYVIIICRILPHTAIINIELGRPLISVCHYDGCYAATTLAAVYVHWLASQLKAIRPTCPVIILAAEPFTPGWSLLAGYVTSSLPHLVRHHTFFINSHKALIGSEIIIATRQSVTYYRHTTPRWLGIVDEREALMARCSSHFHASRHVITTTMAT